MVGSYDVGIGAVVILFIVVRVNLDRVSVQGKDSSNEYSFNLQPSVVEWDVTTQAASLALQHWYGKTGRSNAIHSAAGHIVPGSLSYNRPPSQHQPCV